MTYPVVLDPCCGSGIMWFGRQYDGAVFGDVRHEERVVTDRSHGRTDGVRVLRIGPDAHLDFRALPYADDTFPLVVFDPPHLVRAGKKSWLAAKYGRLGEDWRTDLRQGFAECFRVLRPEGTLVFKWNETQVTLSDVLCLAPVRPLFGHVGGRRSKTHWLFFLKP